MEHLSSSQINLYLQCGEKYKFQYIEKIPRLFKASALAFGSALHSALAWLHQERMKGNGVSLERLYKIFDVDWFSQTVDADIRYKDNEENLKLTVMGKEMLGLYFKEPYRKVMGSEIPFTIPLVNPSTGEELPVHLDGYFDLVEEGDTIVEFKTSAQPLTESDIQSHLQLTAYAYAYTRLSGRQPRALKIVNFVKYKKPKLEVLMTTRGRDHHSMFFRVAEQVYKGITGGIFFPRTGWWCKDCEYAHLCPIWNVGVKAERPKQEVELSI